MAINSENTVRPAPPIRQFGDPVLRQRAEAVAIDEIQSPEMQEIIEDMVAALHAAGGVGLAAPQIGLLRRIFIVEIRAMNRPGYGDVAETPLLVLINPELVEASAELRRAPEACLSIRSADGGVYEGIVERPDRVVMRGLDRSGQEITVAGDKLLARALQHELDHLDGILFTDRITELRDLRLYYPIDQADPVLARNPFLR